MKLAFLLVLVVTKPARAQLNGSYSVPATFTSLDKACKLSFKDVGEINQAIALKADRKAFLFDKKLGSNYKPVLDGREISRYGINWSGKYLKYDINAIHSCKREDIFTSNEKIFFRRVSSSLIGTLDTKQFYALNTLVAINKSEDIKEDIRYILAIFNSRLINYYYSKFLKSTKKVFSEIQARQIAELPYRSINLNNKDEKTIHDKIIKYVDMLLELNKNISKTKQQKEIDSFQKQIDSTDYRINELVYELHRLSEKERSIIEKLDGGN